MASRKRSLANRSRPLSSEGEPCAQETEINRKVAPKPPDGGWGWIIVLSSFMIHVIADGVTYTFGIFYVELVRYFAQGKGLTAWVPSIMTGVTFGIGEFVARVRVLRAVKSLSSLTS